MKQSGRGLSWGALAAFAALMAVLVPIAAAERPISASRTVTPDNTAT